LAATIDEDELDLVAPFLPKNRYQESSIKCAKHLSSPCENYQMSWYDWQPLLFNMSWTGFGLLIWPFAVEKTEEEEAAEEGASALMGLWALEERLEERSLSGMGDGGAAVADFYG
jgi:hypothetical protein